MHPARVRVHVLAIVPVAASVLASALLAGCSSTDEAAIEPALRPSTVAAPSPSTAKSTITADAALSALEVRYGARLGVYVLDTGSGKTVTYHADDRFAFASTLKALAAGVVLKQATDAQLDQVITYGEADLLSYAPVTSKHVNTGMPLRDVLAAALQQSDNTAMNLLLSHVGGPDGLERSLRSLGDTTTNVDRTEPTLNTAEPGDVRDTTTPRAIATSLRTFLLGDVLSGPRKELLKTTMVGNTTGGPYVRAGLPPSWTVGDKTGSGGHGTRNDIAVAWPPAGGAPIVIAMLSDREAADATSDDALLADATRAAVAALRQ